MAGRAAAAAALASCALALAGSGASAAPWSRDLALASHGLDRAVARGRLTPDEASSYRAVLGRAAHALPRLPSSRYRNLAAVVHQVAGFWKGYDEPRSLTLFSMLDFNVSWFSRHWDQKPGTDAVGPDGVWYRAFPGIGFQFHPLEEFGKLNALVSAGDAAATQSLAQELIDRGVPRYGGLSWEYYFRFEGAPPPWVSGMAQAVAAQALARAGT